MVKPTEVVTAIEPRAPQLDFSAAIQNQVGVYEVKPDVFVEVLEKRTLTKHSHFRGSLPESKLVEEGFASGPVYAIYAKDSHVDVAAGLTLINGLPVRQTAVVSKLINRYPTPSVKDLQAARPIAPSHVVLPLASQRMANYCRWWLDSVAKVFICRRSTLLQSSSPPTLDVVLPPLQKTFQQETFSLLREGCGLTGNVSDHLLRGPSINSPGLAFGGGQNIGALVKEFSQFLDAVIPQGGPKPNGGKGERLFISRNETGMRRILNEEDITPGLQDLGFTIMHPAKVPLHTQIEAFRNARVVVAAHGAGLTNIVFCRPGAMLIEIFPEGGVHGSAFVRIASHLNFDYYFVVGQKVENRKTAKNPINADIVLDKASFLSFVRQAITSSSR